MAAGEGFEPSHTESESAVLPLHKPAVSVRRGVHRSNRYYYSENRIFVKGIFKFFSSFFQAALRTAGHPTNRAGNRPFSAAALSQAGGRCGCTRKALTGSGAAQLQRGGVPVRVHGPGLRDIQLRAVRSSFPSRRAAVGGTVITVPSAAFHSSPGPSAPKCAAPP